MQLVIKTNGMNNMQEITVSAPGRICLFGEDVDYMNLEVITLALNQRIVVKGRITNTGKLFFNLRDVNRTIEFQNEKQEISNEREYVASAFNLYQEHLPTSFGTEIEVKSDLLIGKGLSSSSAFTAALVAFFDKAAKLDSSGSEIARKAYLAEVVNLGESGGMMDHYASVIGDVLYLECREPYDYEKININLRGLIIGDTLEKKRDTVEALAQRKREIHWGIQEMKNFDGDFSLENYPLEKVLQFYQERKSSNIQRLMGVLGIRDTVRKGYQVLKSGKEFDEKFAELLNKHHYYQNKYFENVTNKMQNLVDLAKNAGAIGCKLLGTGNGGSFLAFSPGKEKEVMQAIDTGGGKAYLVKQDKGLEIS